MNSEHWLMHLNTLIANTAIWGIDADLTSLAAADAWGLYLYLVRLSES